MFEFYQSSAEEGVCGHDSAVGPTTPLKNVARASLLVWGEHCIECAAPACYKTCNLYEQRPDGRCRRFSGGVQRIALFDSFKGYGVEIRFKTWAMLQARGNIALESTTTIRRQERLVDLGGPILNAFGRWVAKLTKDDRWKHATFSLLDRWVPRRHRTRDRTLRPDAFLLEVYNPENQTHHLRLMMCMAVTPQDEVNPPPFVAGIELPPGYSRHIFDAEAFSAITDTVHPFDISLTPEGDSEPTLVFLSANFVAFDHQVVEEPNFKCLIFDLDHTIWDGVLVEGGSMALKPGVADWLRYCDSRGILLSIASKNDFNAAWSRLKQLGISDYFLFPQMNWGPKSQSVREIAKQLNIGLDSLAFVEDSAFERDEVTAQLPMVTCIDPKELPAWRTHPRFSGSASVESKHRRQFYKDAMVRHEERDRFAGDYIEFLKSCGLVLEVRRFTEADTERVAELVQRTNQLNFSGTKYTLEVVTDILEHSPLQKYVLSCSDKYGFYGTVGFSLAEANAAEVHVVDFMLSCRVQGKLIEAAFFNYLGCAANPCNAGRLWINFRKTDRNTPALNVLTDLGFDDAENGEGMVIDISRLSPGADVVRLVVPDAPPEAAR